MNLNLIGPFVVNAPFGTEIAFAKGLKRMGHGVNTVDPNVESQFDAIDREVDATVVFKSCVGHEERLLGGLRGPVVVYQPDDARFGHIKKMMLEMRRFSDLFLSFDSYGAGVALTMGYRAAETLLLTADDELYCPSSVPIERDIDVSFIGSLGDPVAHASRRKMLEYVRDCNERYGFGWNLQFGTTQHVPTIVDVYRRSKVVLNHATDVGQPFGWGYGLQCRHFEVGLCSTVLLSNQIYGWTVGAKQGVPFAVFEDEAELLDKIDAIVSSKSQLYDPNLLGHEVYSAIAAAHLPQHRARQLVSFIERNT